MGFWDTIGKVAVGVGTAVAEGAKKQSDDFHYYKEEYRSYDNHELKDIAQTKTGMKRQAAIAILKERGLIT